MFDLAGGDDMLGLAVRQLDPVAKQVVCHPEYNLIDTGAASFNVTI